MATNKLCGFQRRFKIKNAVNEIYKYSNMIEFMWKKYYHNSLDKTQKNS